MRLITKFTSPILLFIIFFGFVNASVFNYYPNTLNLFPVNPPITYSPVSTPNVYDSIGVNGTSANISISYNRALWVYDHDPFGSYFVKRDLGYTANLGVEYWFNISLDAHLTNVSSIGVGVVIIGINFTIAGFLGSNTFNASIKYLGGGQVYLDGLGTYSVDPNVKHLFEIRLHAWRPIFFLCSAEVEYYIDGTYIGSAHQTITIFTMNIFSETLYSGNTFIQSTKYDLYLDNINVSESDGVINLFDDYEDGVDDIYTAQVGSGDVGKQVIYYTFPMRILIINNTTVSQTYHISIVLNDYLYSGSGIYVSLWLWNNTMHSTPIIFADGSIISDRTGELILPSGSYAYLYLNISAPISGGPFNLKLNCSEVNRLGQATYLYYPIQVTYP